MVRIKINKSGSASNFKKHYRENWSFARCANSLIQMGAQVEIEADSDVILAKFDDGSSLVVYQK